MQSHQQRLDNTRIKIERWQLVLARLRKARQSLAKQLWCEPEVIFRNSVSQLEDSKLSSCYFEDSQIRRDFVNDLHSR